ncbi:MAG: DoxX family protein [Candidatus Tectomicrobia bacterium]|nr:DoxX family protein [Candidatus Tectomicrobia bacterium]
MNTRNEHMQTYVLLGMRLLLAFIFLWHGVPKAFYVSWAMDKFVGFGLPGILGPITGWVEVIASIGLILGFWHTWSNAFLALIILGALVTVQFPNGMQAGLERDLMILAGLLVLIVTGPGQLALDAKRSESTAPSGSFTASH